MSQQPTDGDLTEELVRQLQQVSPEDLMELDDLVHDAKSREASSINNSGVGAQVAYLVAEGCAQDVIEHFGLAVPDGSQAGG